MRRTIPFTSRGSRKLLGYTCLGLVLLAIACRPNVLNLLGSELVFSSPDDPTAVTQLDAGAVRIDFGQVTIGSTKTLALSLESLSGTVTLGSLTATTPDSEFSLPLSTGMVIGSNPSDVAVSFSPTSIGDKAAVFVLSSLTPATANITIELTGQGVPNGLSVVPDPVDFGQVELNQLQTVRLTITNNASLSATLVVSSLQGPDAKLFSLGAPSTTTLAPNASATLDAVFGPLASGDAGASFTVAGWSDVPPVTVNLTGLGVQSWLQVTSPLNFGFVQLDNTLVKSAQITNVGSFKTLHLIAPAPLLSQPVGSTVFSLPPPAPPLPVTIAPGQSVSVPVAFAPSSLDAFAGTLFLTTDDPGSQIAAIQLQGYGGGPKISCLPQLTFGPTPVAYSTSQSTLCTNAGADIPSHPEIQLQIAQSGLSTDNPAFSPTLSLADGGLAGPGDSVGLASGQSATIEVTFAPQDAGVYESRLTVASNDINDSDAGTILTGEGIVPGPCDLAITPRELSFGNVPPGWIGSLQLELKNEGQALCIITHVTLDSTSSPGFVLPQGDLGYQLLSYPGTTDNPAGLLSTLVVPVDYAPAAVAATASGTIEIAAPNASPSTSSVALTAGSSAAACFNVRPISFDFGDVAFNTTQLQLCAPDSVVFIGLNACDEPVIVSKIEVLDGGDADAGPQFAVEGSPLLPATVSPGGQLAFQVGFTPSDLGEKSGVIAVTTRDAILSGSALSSVTADAVSGALRTDTFTVPTLSSKELDLVWVLDDDDDASQIQSVAALLPPLIDLMNEAQIDYQFAVTSTDTCDAGSSDQGFFEPCDHCISQTSSDALIVTPATPDAGDALVNLFNAVGQFPPWYCEDLNGDEHFFDSLADAFSDSNLSGHNAGFIRPEANLAIVLVNGDGEDDGSHLTNLVQVEALVEGLKPDAGMVAVSYINSGAGGLQASQLVGQLVTATGGTEFDSSESPDVFDNSLLDFFAFAGGSPPFELSTTAASQSQIDVYVNGVQVTDWLYDALQHAIVFDPGHLPAAGSTVTVTYTVGCQ